MNGELAVHELCVSDQLISSFKTKLLAKKMELMSYPTVVLWLQYMDMMDLLRRFLTSKRTGNWNLHLGTLHEMLPFSVAACQNVYTESVYMNLQDIPACPDINEAMQFFTHFSFTTNELHKDMNVARQKKDEHATVSSRKRPIFGWTLFEKKIMLTL
ncbi:hypothetical protein ElyMa_002784800 [Elysia marginata]|uniref:Uncharacterized protein n=1 Tax=Elysia marginata TaxID=1093978 RepID=A0AAV4HLQ6_9GAST|nr:hypothetical protein ElyMa_002784800 [Elysia marginata]